jgi:N6-adenosine-specific RNA methylase IME4
MTTRIIGSETDTITERTDRRSDDGVDYVFGPVDVIGEWVDYHRSRADALMRLWAELQVARYDVVVADPPWSYYGQHDKWAAAAKFYPLMSDADVLSLPVADLLTKFGVLFLWATSPRLDFAIRCIEHWRLAFRGVAFVWVKTTLDGRPIGAQGVRPSIVKPVCEFVLAASKVARGRPMPLADEGVCQTVLAPRGPHSQKPTAVAERIERLYPEARRLELFARSRRSGWDAWGDGIEDGRTVAVQQQGERVVDHVEPHRGAAWAT